MGRKILPLLVLLLVCTPTISSAELIYLKNGKVIRGKIVKITPVYVRIEKKWDDPRREFLTENIEKITHDPTVEEQISGLAIQNLYLREQSPTQQQLRDAAIKRATELVEEAMQNLNSGSTQNANVSMEAIAEEKAMSLVADAIKKADIERFDKAPDKIKAIAMEMANTLLEEAMTSAKVHQLDEMSKDVRVTAQEQIAAIVEQTVKTAEESVRRRVAEQVQTVAEEEASVAVDAAVKRTEETIAKEVSDMRTAAIEEMEKTLTEEEIRDQAISNVAESIESSVEVGQIEELIPEVPIEVVQETIVEEEVAIEGEAERIEEIKEDIQEMAAKEEKSVFDEWAVELEPETLAKVDSLVEQEREEFVLATEPVIEEKKASPIKKEWILIGGIIALLGLFLGGKLSKGKKDDSVSVGEETKKSPNVSMAAAVVSSLLPEDIAAKITEDDVRLILEYESDFYQENKSDIANQKQVAEYVHEKVKELMAQLTLEDVIKILEIKKKHVK